MELKVWVDGIKRVVCGVTDNTSCQDIVIALAQAMGRTGRFTLIEKWRENERPLAPGECPLIVLQKWGEFASEVKLILYESGTRKKQKQSEKQSDVQKVPDRFTHNFTPPVKTSEAVIRRSLTFSGGRKPHTINSYHKNPETLNIQKQGKDLFPQGPPSVSQHSKRYLSFGEKVTSDGNSWSSNSSLSSQNSYINQQQHQQQHSRRSSSHDRMSSAPTTSHDHSQTTHSNQAAPYHNVGMPIPNKGQQYTNRVPQNTNPHPQHQFPPKSTNQQPSNHDNVTIPSHPNTKYQNHRLASNNTNMQQKPNNVAVAESITTSNPNRSVSVNGPVHSSAFSPVRPRRNSSDERPNARISNMDIPMYTDSRKSSQKHDHEEYDLDSNFPDVVKETGQDRLIEEFRLPGGQSHPRNHLDRGEEERIKLLHLVTMQNERIKMQDSQLEIIDTEINSREQKIEDLKLEISQVTEEITTIVKLCNDYDEEIEQLDNGKLIDDIEKEKQVEKEIKHEISALRTRLEKCENNLHQFQVKVKTCSKELEEEHGVLKTDEKRRREEEVKLQSEISDLRKEMKERSEDLDEKTKVYENVESELKLVNKQLRHKTEDLTLTEKELQRENLKFFQNSEETSQSGKNDGEAILKVLEGSGSSKLKRKQLLTSPLTILEMTKKESGVWV
ncbi:Ras association domain-containing protein 8 [Mactra antiquata]